MQTAPVSRIWPLTGRDEELRLIAGTLNTSSDQVGVAIVGRAGIGKSRLARESAAAAERNGFIVRWAAGTASSQAIPLGALAQWAESLEGSHMQLVGRVVNELGGSGGERVLVVVDDAQLLDDMSALVLHQLVLRKAASVLVTIRGAEPVPDAITALWKDGYLRLLELQSLSRVECDEVMSAALGGEIGALSSQRMWEITGGNVLYLRHLVEQEAAAHRLEQHEGTWHWTMAPVVSPTLANLIEAHVGSVPDRVLEAIDTVAVAEPVDMNLLSAVVDPAALEEAERRGLITVADGAATVGHPLYGELRRSSAGQMRLRRLRGRIASELARREGLDDTDVIRVAVLWLESDLPTEPAMYLRAAHAAFTRLDLRLAERFAEQCAHTPGSADAWLLRAQALGLMNRAEESQLVLAQPPNDILNEGLRAGSLALNASNLWIPLERTGESMAVIDAALDDSNDTIRETASAFRVVQLALSGYPDEAIARGETVNRDMLGDFQTLILASALTISLGDVGRIGELTSVVEEGYARADCSAEAAYLGIGLAENHVNALVLAGEVAEAVAAADAVYRRCGDAPGAIGAMGRAIAGTASLACGQLDRAKDRLSSAAAEFAECGAGRGIRYRFAVGEVVALAKLGDTSSAAAKLEAVRHGHPALELMEADRLLAMAWVSAARGLLSRATGQANAAARFARTRGQLSREVVSLQTAAHFGDGSAAVRLAELAPVVGGPRAATAAAFAVGLRDRDGRSLQGAAETYESTGDAYAAADAWAHAANAYRADGRRGSALTASAQAQRLARECGGASSAALRAAGQPLPLTPREREVLALVAEGLSNRQIAGAMGMSIRTVEGHIYRASVRAGVSSRFQLGALVRDLGEALD